MALTKTVKKDITARLEAAKELSGKSMGVDVAFFTPEALAEAQQQLSGRRGFKNVTPILWDGKIPVGVSTPEIGKGDGPRSNAGGKAPVKGPGGKAPVEAPGDDTLSVDDLV